MSPEEADCQDSCLILDARDQSVIVALDVEHHSAALENASFWIRCLDILGGAPLSAAHNREPSIVLRPCCFDPLVADVCPEVALDDVGTDDDYLLEYGTDFPKFGRRT